MSKLNKESVIGISALLVHAANIDEIYSDQLNISTVWLNDVIKISNQIIKKDPYGLTNFK